MNLLGIFGSKFTTARIPNYEQGIEQDSIDLQVKSLLYVFKRFRINKLSSFLGNEDEGHAFKYSDGFSEDPDSFQSNPYFQKLDAMYNVEKFRRTMTEDEYRVLVDFIKNKFRSFCILSDYPSKQNGTDDQLLPVFKDYKDRPMKNFHFVVMPIQRRTQKDIAETLASSDIYCEHFHVISYELRYEYAMEAFTEVIQGGINSRGDKEATVSDDDNALIIKTYLRKMAYNVQFRRLFRKLQAEATLVPRLMSSPQKEGIDSFSPTLRSRSQSPTKTLRATKAAPISQPKLSPQKSLRDLSASVLSSPKKGLKSMRSLPNLWGDSSIKSVRASKDFFLDHADDSRAKSQVRNNDRERAIESSRVNADANPNADLLMDIRARCETAIMRKLEREKKILGS